MANTSAERDLQRGRDLRKLARNMVDAGAKSDFMEAASRLERRAAKKVRKLGRKSGKRRGPSIIR